MCIYIKNRKDRNNDINDVEIMDSIRSRCAVSGLTYVLIAYPKCPFSKNLARVYFASPTGYV